MLFDGSYGIIEAVKSVHYDKPQTTYNFEVADFHTYYVGTGVLVHNMGAGTCHNPNGRKGGDAHQGKIEQVKKSIEDAGYTPGREVGFNIEKVLRQKGLLIYHL